MGRGESAGKVYATVHVSGGVETYHVTEPTCRSTDAGAQTLAGPRTNENSTDAIRRSFKRTQKLGAGYVAASRATQSEST